MLYISEVKVETLFFLDNNGVIISLLLKEQHQELLCDLWDIIWTTFFDDINLI